jgi:3-oxoacyl-[acyl-carrier-protein] synthase III
VGTTIESVAYTTGSWRDHRSARRLADRAARLCLERAGVEPGEIGLLVNVGLYRDRILGEPALAALIQEDIGAHPEDPHAGTAGTFSFDLANGACGVLSALQVADGFLRSGAVRHVLIVASDADPGRRMAPRFPFGPSGGAVLCGWDAGRRGLVAFRWETEPGTANLFRATVNYEDGHNRLHIDQAPEFADVATRWATKVAGALMADRALRPSQVDLAVVNPLGPSQQEVVAGLLGVDADRVACADPDRPVHTAGLIASLATAHEDGRLSGAGRVLLTAAGAGVTAGAALLEA